MEWQCQKLLINNTLKGVQSAQDYHLNLNRKKNKYMPTEMNQPLLIVPIQIELTQI